MTLPTSHTKDWKEKDYSLHEWRQNNKEKDFSTVPEPSKFEKNSIFIEIKTPNMMIHFETQNQDILRQYHNMISEMFRECVSSEKVKQDLNKKMFTMMGKNPRKHSHSSDFPFNKHEYGPGSAGTM